MGGLEKFQIKIDGEQYNRKPKAHVFIDWHANLNNIFTLAREFNKTWATKILTWITFIGQAGRRFLTPGQAQRNAAY